MNDNATNESSAVRDILAERLRQISDEGWTPEHDEIVNSIGQLALAGAAYAISGAGDREVYGHGRDAVATSMARQVWPWRQSWFKPTDPRRDLVKAAALIIAEIERLDRIRPELCPVCGVPFVSSDVCSSDIELGTCHAECLRGSPVVNLDSGEPTDGPIATYRYDSLDDPDAMKSETADK